MTKRIIAFSCFTFCSIAIYYSLSYWLNTQPIKVANDKSVTIDSVELPGINKQIVDFIEREGSKIAPTYDTAICTEFVIQVINQFRNLNKEEKKLIRIITTENLPTLIQKNSSVIKGVQTALHHGKKGLIIENPAHVMPGDFVQFWNLYNGSAYGHCGVVLSLEIDKKITVYSSHPLTNGYGKQTFLWPDKVFFVRLN